MLEIKNVREYGKEAIKEVRGTQRQRLKWQECGIRESRKAGTTGASNST
jgi:hypothetical protein